MVNEAKVKLLRTSVWFRASKVSEEPFLLSAISAQEQESGSNERASYVVGALYLYGVTFTRRLSEFNIASSISCITKLGISARGHNIVTVFLS